jgi:hypothetical protein
LFHQSDASAATAISRIEKCRQYNGTTIEAPERKNCELFYMKDSLKTFLIDLEAANQGNKYEPIKDLDDERLGNFMNVNHPRWYELVSKFGNPFEMISLKIEKSNMNSTSAKVTLISEGSKTNGKTLSKKLLLTMTVAALKSMCSKLFKIEVIHQ